MKKKQCFKCLGVKFLIKFYKHTRQHDGYLNKCKECAKQDTKNNYRKNIDYYRAYDKKRHKKGYIRPVREKFIQTYKNLIYKTWEGSKSEYRLLHYWVEKNLGKPSECMNCKRKGLSGRNIHWANKSHKYKRDKNDWIRLCVYCHQRYDKDYEKTKQIAKKE